MDCDTWPVPLLPYEDADLCVGNGCVIPADTDPDLLAAASAQAGVIMRTLSGGRAGVCIDVVRPLGDCATCRGACHCIAGDRLHVTSDYGPVTAVTEVDDGGDIVDPSEYRFYPSSQLLYRAPPATWPRRDLKWADCGEADTFCVTVEVGYEPDAWALAVHAELTCELLKSCTDQPCRLPRNATTVVGQGVSVTLSPTELKQFIPAVAGWVAAINPDNAQGLPRLFSPDAGDCHG